MPNFRRLSAIVVATLLLSTGCVTTAQSRPQSAPAASNGYIAPGRPVPATPLPDESGYQNYDEGAPIPNNPNEAPPAPSAARSLPANMHVRMVSAVQSSGQKLKNLFE